MTDRSQVLERFHRALIEEIQLHRPEYLTEPFTVAEIYQNLVPYRTHRDRLGVEMNGDYEDALVRLLAGEGGYLILESEPALKELRAELQAANPNTGIYREYAAVDVRLNQALLDLAPHGVQDDLDLDAAVAADPVSMADLAPSEALSDLAVPPRARPKPAGASPNGGPARAEDAKPTCQWCRAELPVRDNLNFCPFCGTDLKVVPCPECGEELEPDWRFCISCGSEVTR